MVGHDVRPSSPGLSRAFAHGAAARGADTVLIGLCSTDQLYFASGQLGLPGAMFTASHDPARYNGIKLCRAGAAPFGRDTGLGDVRALVEQWLRWLTAGESHGPALVATLEGLPACVPVTTSLVAAELAVRRLGHGRGARMRFEQDEVTLLGGVRHGLSLGSPVAVTVGNSEWRHATSLYGAGALRC